MFFAKSMAVICCLAFIYNGLRMRSQKKLRDELGYRFYGPNPIVVVMAASVIFFTFFYPKGGKPITFTGLGVLSCIGFLYAWLYENRAKICSFPFTEKVSGWIIDLGEPTYFEGKLADLMKICTYWNFKHFLSNSTRDYSAKAKNGQLLETTFAFQERDRDLKTYLAKIEDVSQIIQSEVDRLVDSTKEEATAGLTNIQIGNAETISITPVKLVRYRYENLLAPEGEVIPTA